MRYTPIRVVRNIALIDQETSAFNELVRQWLEHEENRERLVDLFDQGLSAVNPFEDVYFSPKELVAFLSHDGIRQVQLVATYESTRWLPEHLREIECSELVEQFIAWIDVNNNRTRLQSFIDELGTWSSLLREAFLGNQTDEAILNCFASYRIRQLTSRALSKIYFSEEEGAE